MKKNNLQPWLDYFNLLNTYEQGGFLQMDPDKHEAYVTQPAIHAMSDGDEPTVQMADGSIFKTVRRLRAYAGWKSQQGKMYLWQNFAVHVVKPDEPHDLLYTVLLFRRRRWWSLLWKVDSVQVIDYNTRSHG